MSTAAELILPAIRWDADAGFDPYRERIERWLAMGPGGFIFFGGERDAVRALTAELRRASTHELLIASDVERGAGQQVQGLTSLPPLAALAGMGRPAVIEAARLTALECLDAGFNWALSPVCDLDIEPDNPIVQTRSFGADAYEVGHLAAAWSTACQDAGVLACAKHFPGHGRTTLDSHATLPVVGAGRELERDLLPFRIAVAAGVASVMSCHVAFPAWDSSGAAATHSSRILRDLLRRDLFFGGITVTDALIMEGARAGEGEAAGAAMAIEAGCDLLLYPHEPVEVAEGLEKLASGVRDRASAGGLAAAMEHAALRRDEAVRRAKPPRGLDADTLASHRERGRALCREAVTVLRGEPRPMRRGIAIEIVDDDAGGPYPLPPRTAFQDELHGVGVDVRPRGERVVLLFADVKSWKGRSGLSAESRARLAKLVDQGTPVILFGHPRRLADIPGNGPVFCAWSGDVAMQQAAARFLISA